MSALTPLAESKSSCTAYLSYHTPTLVPCLQNMKLASFLRSNPHVFRLEHGWVFLNDFCCRAAPALTTVEEAIECLRTGKHSVSYFQSSTGTHGLGDFVAFLHVVDPMAACPSALSRAGRPFPA